jgi:hypothetical protein
VSSEPSFAMQLTAPMALVMDLVAWVAARPRTYLEAR